MPLSKDTQKPMHAHADEAEVLRVLVAQHLALGQLALARAAARDLARIAGSSHVVNFLRHAARDDLGGPPALASTILRDHETRAWALRTEARALEHGSENAHPDAADRAAEFEALLTLVGSPEFTEFGDDARVDGARLDHLGLQVLVETLRKYWHPSAQPLDSCKESDERGVLEDPESEAGLRWAVRHQARLLDVMWRLREHQRDPLSDAVQALHLHSVERMVQEGQFQRACNGLRFLHVSQASAAADYRDTLSLLLTHALEQEPAAEPSLRVHNQLLASGCAQLASLAEEVDARLTAEASGVLRWGVGAADATGVLQWGVAGSWRAALDAVARFGWPRLAIVGNLLLPATALKLALAALMEGQARAAVELLREFPRLRELAALLAWDLLEKEQTRQPGMSLTEKQGMLVLMCTPEAAEEDASTFLGSASCCVRSTCDELVFRLHFVEDVVRAMAAQLRERNPMHHLDPQAEAEEARCLLANLTTGSPLRVLLPHLRWMPPSLTTRIVGGDFAGTGLAEPERRADVELLHMHYALHTACTLVWAAMADAHTGSGRHEDEQAGDPALNLIDQFHTHVSQIHSPARLVWVLEAAFTITRVFPPNTPAAVHVTPLASLHHLRRFLAVVQTAAERVLNGAPSSEGAAVAVSRADHVKREAEEAIWRLCLATRLRAMAATKGVRGGEESGWANARAVMCAPPPGIVTMCLHCGAFQLALGVVDRYCLPAAAKVEIRLAQWWASTASVAVQGGRDGAATKWTPLDWGSLEEETSGVTKAALFADMAVSLAGGAGQCWVMVRRGLAAAAAAPTSGSTAEAVVDFLQQLEKMLMADDVASARSSSASPPPALLPRDRIVGLAAPPPLARSPEDLQAERSEDSFECAENVLESLGVELGDPGDGTNTSRQRLQKRYGAVVLLDEAVHKADLGERQYLSGILRNLAGVLAESPEEDGAARSRHVTAAGVGLSQHPCLKPVVPKPAASTVGPGPGRAPEPAASTVEPASAHLLAAVLKYIVDVGDEVAGGENSDAFHYFQLLHRPPRAALMRLVLEKVHLPSSATTRVAALMGADLVQEVLSTVALSVHPPPQRAPQPQRALQLHRHPQRELDASSVALTCSAQQSPPLHLEVARQLGEVSPLRALLACVFVLTASKASSKQPLPQDLCDLWDFASERSLAYPAMSQWVHMKLGNLKRSAEGPDSPKLPAPVNDDDLVRQVEDEVDSLISRGRLEEALALADDAFVGGPPDSLLVQIAEHPLASKGASGGAASDIMGQPSESLFSLSWRCCVRLRDKQLAARVVLTQMHSWSLEAARDAVDRCCCHLATSDPARAEVDQWRGRLERLSRVLAAVPSLDHWQEANRLYEQEPEKLVHLLARAGAFPEALDVATERQLAAETCSEVRGGWLHRLLDAPASQGGGAAACLRFLRSLGPCAMAAAAHAMRLERRVPPRLLVVHLMLHKLNPPPSPEDARRLRRMQLGLQALQTLPATWADRCAMLAEQPGLILEMLVMNQQLDAAATLLRKFPNLGDDELVEAYAAYALGCPRGAASNNMGPEAPLGGARDVPEGNAPPGREHSLGSTTWVLSGDVPSDARERARHVFPSAPNAALGKAILALSSTEAVDIAASVNVAARLARHRLAAGPPPGEGRSAHMDQREWVRAALCAAEVVHSTLQRASERAPRWLAAHVDDPAASTQTVRDAQKQAEELLPRMVLLQVVLSAGEVVRLEEVTDERGGHALTQRLTSRERYSLAVYVARQLGLDARPMWTAWGLALYRVGDFQGARTKLSQGLRFSALHCSSMHSSWQEHRKLAEDLGQHGALRAVATLERVPAADVRALSELYRHLEASVTAARQAPEEDDVALDAAAFLQTLHVPVPVPKMRARPSSSIQSAMELGSAASLHKWQTNAGVLAGSHLRGEVYARGEELLKTHASTSHLLAYMFRHGRVVQACKVVLEMALADGAGPDVVGRLEQVCAWSVAFGATKLLQRAVLDLSVAAPASSDGGAGKRASVMRLVSAYFLGRSHLRALHRFLQLSRDHAAAGLACVQMFLCTGAGDEGAALRHLASAAIHFQDALNEKHKSLPQAQCSTPFRGSRAAQRPSESELMDLLVTTKLQDRVVRVLGADSAKSPASLSLFGPRPRRPAMATSSTAAGRRQEVSLVQRRSSIAEALLEIDFDLAFRLIGDFRLPATRIYSQAAARLARAKARASLLDLLHNIGNTIEDAERDGVIGEAIAVYTNVHKDTRTAKKLAQYLMMSSSRVVAHLQCGSLREAADLATGQHGSVLDARQVINTVRHMESSTQRNYAMKTCEAYLVTSRHLE